MKGAAGMGTVLGFGIALLVLGCGDTKSAAPAAGGGWAPDEQTAFARAKAENKAVMVHFAAAWAVPTQELELLYRDPEVARAIEASFVPVSLDVSASTDEDMARRNRYGAQTLPAVVFVTVDGKVRGRVAEVVSKDKLLDAIARAK